MNVHTWSDGFGIWHARVEEGGNVIGDSTAAAALALSAIREALGEREGSSYDPSTVSVRLSSRTSRDGVLSSEFVEVETAPIDVDAFFDAYLECALWSSSDQADNQGGRPLDENCGSDDIHPDSLAEMRSECEDFISANTSDLLATGADASQMGHDFWLTRNGHGAGFWDRGYGAIGDRLSEASKVYGGVDIYVGDDGKLYS